MRKGEIGMKVNTSGHIQRGEKDKVEELGEESFMEKVHLNKEGIGWRILREGEELSGRLKVGKKAWMQ